MKRLHPLASRLSRPMGRLAEAVVRARRRRGARHVVRLPIPVVSVGNIAVGGTGKTPATEALVAALEARGKRVGVVMGAYRARPPLQETASGRRLRWALVSDGEQLLADVETAGDEAIMFAVAYPHVPLGIGKRKALVAQELARMFPLDCLVLDDGFQHLRLARDLDIVLVDARSPFDNGRVLPAGMLREPPDALQWADVILLTHAEEAEVFDAARDMVRQHAHDARTVRAFHRPTRFRIPATDEVLPLDAVKGTHVLAVCGIGSPDGFAATLNDLGASDVELYAFPDHHLYRSRDWQGIAARAEHRTIVTTAKDSVKWVGNVSFPYWVLDVRLEWTPENALDDSLDRLFRRAQATAR